MIFKEKMNIHTASELYTEAKDRHEAFRNEAKKSTAQYKTGLTGHAKDNTFGLIYNATRELIDAQLRIDIPVPMVKPQIDNVVNRERARTITAMLHNEIDRIPFEELNDLWERESYITGGSVASVEYLLSDDYKDGAVSVEHIKATEFFPQPDIDRIDNMDYYFIIQDRTKTSIIDEYGEEFRAEITNETTNDESEADKDNEDIVTLILMFYKLNGKWAHFAYVGNIELANLEDYYARKDELCSKCGSTSCDCDAKKVKTSREGIPLMRPLKTRYHDISATVPVMDDNGEPVMINQIIGTNILTGTPVYAPAIAQEPRVIPYYTIKSAPIAVRKNETNAGALFGQSDCEAIRSLQEGMNIASTKILEKMVNSGYIMTKPESMSFELSNVMGRVLSVEAPDQLAMMKSIAFEFNSQADYYVLNQSYQYAKAVLGVTDSYQGKPDSTAQSGRAKEAQISQSAGIHRMTQSLKNVFFSNIYRCIFQAMLAFDDGDHVYANPDNKEQSFKFSRLDFLDFDESGNLFYEDRFNFSVDETGINPNNRSEVLQNIAQDFSSGLYGDPATAEARLNLWKERQYLDFPGSTRQVEYWETKVKEEKEMLAQQQQMMQVQQMMGGDTVDVAGAVSPQAF